MERTERRLVANPATLLRNLDADKAEWVAALNYLFGSDEPVFAGLRVPVSPSQAWYEVAWLQTKMAAKGTQAEARASLPPLPPSPTHKDLPQLAFPFRGDEAEIEDGSPSACRLGAWERAKEPALALLRKVGWTQLRGRLGPRSPEIELLGDS